MDLWLALQDRSIISLKLSQHVSPTEKKTDWPSGYYAEPNQVYKSSFVIGHNIMGNLKYSLHNTTPKMSL